MHLLKEEYARKRIHNSILVRIENSVTWDNCLASLGEPHDAKQLPSDRIFNPHLTTIKDSYIPDNIGSSLIYVMFQLAHMKKSLPESSVFVYDK